MFEKKTVVVVGAGASKEAGLPTGHELKMAIASILDIRFENGYTQSSGDHQVCAAIQELVRQKNPNDHNINPHLEMAWRIRDAMPQAISIDNFIDAHQGNTKLEECGKLAIVRAILNAEKNSLIYVDRNNSNNKLDQNRLIGTWFNAFFQLLTENCRAKDLEARLSLIKLIVFNYDRCIEHFLYHSLQTYYGLNESEAARLIKGIDIYHPYGMVGTLPWHGEGVVADFGERPSSQQLVKLASQIRTFTEGTDPDGSSVRFIREVVTECNIFLFLGFAYHRLNLALIRPTNPHTDPISVRYYGTAKGISNEDCETIRNELSKLGGANKARISLRNDLTCSELFREYWRGLSLA